jgi:hypothetical protein
MSGGEVPMNCSAKPVASRTPTSRPNARVPVDLIPFEAETAAEHDAEPLRVGKAKVGQGPLRHVGSHGADVPLQEEGDAVGRVDGGSETPTKPVDRNAMVFAAVSSWDVLVNESSP